MATRTQISLDDELYARARERAEALGVSVEEYIGHLVAEALPERKRRYTPSDVVGLGSSGGTNIARDKHRLIAEAIAADKLK